MNNALTAATSSASVSTSSSSCGLMIVLAALGYTKGRTAVKVAEEARKAEESKAAGLLAMAREKIAELKVARDKAKVEKDAAASRAGALAPGTPVAGTPEVTPGG